MAGEHYSYCWQGCLLRKTNTSIWYLYSCFIPLKWKLAQYLQIMVFRRLRKIKLKWIQMVLYDHRSIYVLYPCVWIPATQKVSTNIPNLPPEHRKLFQISELHKIKNPFSLFRQWAAKFQISTICAKALHWHIQNKFCLSNNGFARQYCISLEKENYNDIGTPLEFCQENDNRITTLLQH